ncbi:MAG: T9SS type A sorting domain-containing protein [Bacteroidia bacterium]
MMKYYLLSVVAILFTCSATAQQVKLYPSVTPKIVSGSNHDTLYNPFAGGLVGPQFSNIDMNFDGKQDLLVFDISGNQILPFIDEGERGEMSFRYRQDYADFFPPARNFMLLADYNNDGLPDFFTYSRLGSGMEIWENTSENDQLSFELRTPQVLFPHNNYETNVFIGNTDLPALTDVDGDGRLDILNFGTLGGYVYYYRNVSLNPDSLRFCLMDECFGKWLESSTTNAPILGISCGPRDTNCNRLRLEDPDEGQNKKHAGSTLLALDMDGDNDKDLVVGDISYPNLILYTNGTKELNNGGVDTFISYDTAFPASTVPVDIFYSPAAFYVDVNGDGIRDMVSAPFEPRAGKKLNQVWLYLNNGADNNPDFEFKTSRFLQEEMLDLGSKTAPVFVDIDADGDMDLIVATAGEYMENFNMADRLVLYENIGSATDPIYVLKDDDYLSLKQQGHSDLRPAFGDINGDNSSDLLIGTRFGNFIYYENTAEAGNPMEFTFKTNDFKNMGSDIGYITAPFIYDLNGDGKNDLIIGEAGGNINYYQNTGQTGNPSYTLITETLGNIHTNSFFYTYDYDTSGNIIDSTIVMESTGASAPVIADFNGDGTPELVSGSLNGKIFFFEVGADPNAEWQELDTVFYNYILERGVNRKLGYFSTVTTASINKDSLPDLIVGSERGGLVFFSSIDEGLDSSGSVGITPKPAATIQVRVFPNPAQDELNLSISNPSSAANYHVEMIGLTGQTVYLNNLENGRNSIIIPTDDLPRGIYLLRITDRNSSVHYTTQKVVLR